MTIECKGKPVDYMDKNDHKTKQMDKIKGKMGEYTKKSTFCGMAKTLDIVNMNKSLSKLKIRLACYHDKC